MTWCSTVGLRSGKYAKELMKGGYTNVRNLEGSILQWVRNTAVHTLVYSVDIMQVHRLQASATLLCWVDCSGSADSGRLSLVTGDQESTKDVHVFSRSWALQGDGYTPHFFANGR